MPQPIHILAQATATAPASGPAPSFLQSLIPSSETYSIPWDKWLDIHGWSVGLRAACTLALILLLGVFLSRMFRSLLLKYQLLRPVRWGTLALAIYSALIATHPGRMTDPHDLLALIIHRLFVIIMLLVAIRFLDRLVIIPILTRGGRVTLSRFIHQIVTAIICLFFATGYLHWAFDVDVSSLLAGSAVISIVLGLALQETLGNFFSGMVLQASVPFAPGDWILIGEGASAVEGRVVEMTWRAVTLITPANNNILIPNSTVARTKITNYHTPSPATACSISIALDHNLSPHEARRILLLAVRDIPGVLANPAPGVGIASYDPSLINYSIGFWIDKPETHGGIEAAARWNVWYRLRQAGIRLPVERRAVETVESAQLLKQSEDKSQSERLAAIGKSPLFSTLSPELQQKLAAQTTDFTLAAGQTFYRQDDPADSLFLILSGTVHASMRTEDDRNIDLGDTSIGGIFGEVAAFTGQPRTATITAKTDVRAIQITPAHLQNLLSQDPDLAKHMSEVVAEAQAKREELFKQLGAHHPSHGQNTQPQSVLDRMKSFLNLIHY